MDASWRNLLLDDKRPRSVTNARQAKHPDFIAAARLADWTNDQMQGAAAEQRCKLVGVNCFCIELPRTGRTLPASVDYDH